MNPNIKTPEDFAGHHGGQTPQEYFASCVRDDADPPRLAEFEAGLAAAKVKLAAAKGWEALQADDPKFQAGSDAEDKIAYFDGLVRSDKIRAKFALAFLAGKMSDYGQFLNTEGQLLIKLGWIDTTLVP